MTNLSRYWPLVVLLLALPGCGGTSPTSPSGGKSATELIESGNAALARGELDQALADFSSAKDVQADSALARERRAAVFLQMKKFDQAVYDCTEALKIDGKLAPAYFTRGLAEEGLGDTDKALEDFIKALDSGLDPVAELDVVTARGGLYYSMAKASVKPDEVAKFLEMALKDFDRAVKLDPHRAESHVQRAVVRLDFGDYEGAVTDCDAALKVDPKLAAAYVARARGECELSELDKAVTDCDSAVHLDDNLIEGYVIRAKARLEKSSEMRTLAELAECRQAVADCRRAIKESKKKVEGASEGRKKHAETMRGLAHELRGSIYQTLNATKKALAEYEQALALDPYLVSALLRRATTRSAAGDFAGALNDSNTAIGIDSTRPEAYSGRGWVYAAKGEFPKAIEDFNQAVSLDHKCAKAYSGRALIYSGSASGELKKAVEIDNKIREMFRGHPSSSQEREKMEELVRTLEAEAASCRQRANELHQKCIDDATDAITANRHLARAYLTRALAYAVLGIAEKSLADFAAAIREDPKMVKVYFNRAVLLVKMNHLDAAIKDFEEASKLQPDAAKIYENLFKLYLRKGDTIMANKYMKIWQEKVAKHRQEQEEFLEDIVPKPKKPPEIRPDAELDPLENAKRELENYLDATADQ